MSTQTLQQLKELIGDKLITHEEHDTIPRSSHEAAKIRGSNVEDGAKAIICVDKKGFFQVVVRAHQRIDMKALKQIREQKNITLASPQDVLQLTDCVVGSVPPFGILWDIPVYVDEQVVEKDEIVFSAGTLNDSIYIHPQDLVDINKAQVIAVSKDS